MEREEGSLIEAVRGRGMFFCIYSYNVSCENVTIQTSGSVRIW